MKNTLILFSLFLNFHVFAQSTYHNFDDFKDACANAQPGDEIILASGRYDAESITIKNVAGTPDNPVIIRAEQNGADTLDNGTYFDLRHCSYITIQGFVINISEKSTTFKIQTCDHIRITQNVLDGSGEDYYKADGVSRNSSVWVSIQSLWDDPTGLSHHNHIDHNLFRNKHTLGNMIRIDGTDETYVSQYDVIEYNHFKNMGPRAENEMEAIRIGWSAMSQSDGYCKVSNNLFEECNGDPEIISVKCNKNTLSHNTFLRCQGTLSLRHGNESLIEGNFFLGEGAEGTGGVRIYGSDHRIINNYFEGLTGTKWDAPITLTNGDAEEGSTGLSKHYRIERAVIANNTLVNNHHGIEVGYNNNGNYSKPPRDVVMAYNLVTSDTGSLVKYINSPANMTWVNNLLYASGDAILAEGVSFTDEEAITEDPYLERIDSLMQFKASSSTPGYIHSNTITGAVEYDIDGHLRSAPTQYGADEFSDAKVLYHPMKAGDVGPDLEEYLQINNPSVSFSVSADTIDVAIYSNLEWEVIVDESWLTVVPMQGSGDASIKITVEINESGVPRTTAVGITSTNAENGENINQQISVTQAGTVPPELTLAKENLYFNSASSSETVALNSNTDWHATADVTWISIDPASGNGSAELNISVEENTGRATRRGNVLVKDNGNLEASINIEQEGSVGSEEKLIIIDAVASTEQAENGNIAANVFDGNLGNRWSGEGDGAYIDLKLDEESVVSFIKVGLYKGNERLAYFDIQTSVDGETFYDAITGITSEITTESLVIYDITDTTARYVRIIGHGNSTNMWNSFTEFEIWGWLQQSTNVGTEIYNDLPVKFYPNPSDGIIFLETLPGALVEIREISGRQLLVHRVKETFERLETGLSTGLYFLTIKNKERSISHKIIINK